ncbi:unnamed protein product [Lactuca virosa]|uniref:Uncharacterized protein n=1 Tax=Lactuca virosa TaxID=75947 RepID=A0AAU9MRW1_9ASTR|nr:unnamed protein product [Lactuca virosa]
MGPCSGKMPDEFNITWLHRGDPILNVSDLSIEASRNLGLLLDQLRYQAVKSLSNMVVIVLIKRIRVYKTKSLGQEVQQIILLRNLRKAAAQEVVYEVRQHNGLLVDKPDTLLQLQKEDGTCKDYPVGAALEATKNTLIQDSIKLLLDFSVVFGQELGLKGSRQYT